MESMRENAAADVLLLIEAPFSPSLILPTKLVDYLPMGKPILGLIPPEGTPAELMGRLGCPQVVPDDAAGIALAVGELLDRWQAGTLTVPPQFSQVAPEYDIRQTTRLFDRVLREISGHQTSASHPYQGVNPAFQAD
jgi:hypothetical protein